MIFYGLHWTFNGETPLQIRIETRTCEVWARSCPRGGEWTAWRRLDARRKADGTLDEVADKAINAETADTAVRLARPVTFNLTGAVVGNGQFDGGSNVFIKTSIGSAGELGELQKRLKELEMRVASLEGGGA